MCVTVLNPSTLSTEGRNVWLSVQQLDASGSALLMKLVQFQRSWRDQSPPGKRPKSLIHLYLYFHLFVKLCHTSGSCLAPPQSIRSVSILFSQSPWSEFSVNIVDGMLTVYTRGKTDVQIKCSQLVHVFRAWELNESQTAWLYPIRFIYFKMRQTKRPAICCI